MEEVWGVLGSVLALIPCGRLTTVFFQAREHTWGNKLLGNKLGPKYNGRVTEEVFGMWGMWGSGWELSEFHILVSINESGRPLHIISLVIRTTRRLLKLSGV